MALDADDVELAVDAQLELDHTAVADHQIGTPQIEHAAMPITVAVDAGNCEWAIRSQPS